MFDFSEDILIVPDSLKEHYLQVKRANPSSKCKIYSLVEAQSFFYYHYDYRALNYLVKKGLSYFEAKRILDLLSFMYKRDLKAANLQYLEDYKNELLAQKFLYLEDLPDLLFKDKKIRVEGFSDPASLWFLNYHLKDADIKFVPIGEYSLTPQLYEFNDPLKEALYLLNRVAERIDKGTLPSSIHIVGASPDFQTLLIENGVFYNITFTPENVPLVSLDLFQAFLKNISESETDEDVLVRLLEEFDSDGAYQIAELIDIFKDIGFERRLALYKEASLAINVSLPMKINSVKFENDYEFIEGDTYIVVGGALGLFPKTYQRNPLLSDEQAKILGLDHISLDNEIAIHDARNLLHSPELLYASYSSRNGKNKLRPSTLFLEVQEEFETPTLDYEYSIDKGILLQALLLDEQQDIGVRDPRLNSLQEKVNLPHYAFPYDFESFENIPYPKSHSFSSLSTYNRCPFAYFCEKILKIQTFTDSFATRYGELLHHALEKLHDKDHDTLKAINESLESFKAKTDLSPKEEALFKKIIDIVPTIVFAIKQIDEAKDPHGYRYEMPFKVDLADGHKLTGKIDKIILNRLMSDYFVQIIDYKSSAYATHFSLEDFENYHVGLQLPLYAYAVKQLKEFDLYDVGQVAYQQCLPSNNDLINDMSLDWISKRKDAISKIVSPKGLEAKEDGVKHDYTAINELADKAYEIALEMVRKIQKGEFPIKAYATKALDSCSNCEYRNICYRSKNALVYGPKKEDEDVD